jgi:hypothetical protein
MKSNVRLVRGRLCRPRLGANVSICVRAGLPKPRAVPDSERIKDTKRWITRQPRLTQIQCWQPFSNSWSKLLAGDNL